MRRLASDLPLFMLLTAVVGGMGAPAPLLHILSTAAACLCPSTSLDEFFFFNSLAVGLPYSLVFWLFWLFFVFKLVVVFLLVVQGNEVYPPMPPS